ncbi:MAG: alpha-E domain-containing protein [Myxococcota bacterium]
MISRVADHCFWLGRYLERAESTARVLSVTRQLSLDAELPAAQCWRPVLIVSGEEEGFLETLGDGGVADGDRVQDYMTWSDDNASSIQASVSSARENARAIREVVSQEFWMTLNELYLWMNNPQGRAQYRDDRDGFYRHIREATQLCLGVLRNTMLHDNAFHFISIGLLLERCGQTARILDVHHHVLTQLSMHQVVEAALWLSLLRACAGGEPYMKTNHGRIITPDGVAAFLVLEPAFPRSIHYCLIHSYNRLRSIRSPEEPTLPGRDVMIRLGDLQAWLAKKTPAILAREDIHALLTHVVDETAAICDGIRTQVLGLGQQQSQVSAQ